MLVKIHKSYREIVAICDKELLGKEFKEENKKLEIKENFFNGEEISEEKVVELMKLKGVDDATFNIVGEKSVNLAVKTGLVNEKAIGKINGVPFALVLL